MATTVLPVPAVFWLNWMPLMQDQVSLSCCVLLTAAGFYWQLMTNTDRTCQLATVAELDAFHAGPGSTELLCPELYVLKYDRKGVFHTVHWTFNNIALITVQMITLGLRGTWNVLGLAPMVTDPPAVIPPNCTPPFNFWNNLAIKFFFGLRLW